MVVSAAGARAASAQFTIDELELHYTAGAGQAVTRLIPIKSESDSVQQGRLWVRDWMRDSVGGNQMVTYGESGHSCGPRLSVFPLTLQLAARATEFVRVTYEPAGATDPGCWAIVLSETVRPPAETAASGASVTITTVVGVKVYVHAATARSNGTIVSADVEEFWESAQNAGAALDSSLVRQVAVRFQNTGTAHLRVKSTVEIRDESARVIRRLDGPEAYLTPDAFRDILVRLPTLERGRYIAVVLLDYGADEITAAQIDFEVR